MQEVDRKLLLRFLHSPHPCGLATPSQGWSMDRSVAENADDADSYSYLTAGKSAVDYALCGIKFDIYGGDR